jgi:hypothetical protein
MQPIGKSTAATEGEEVVGMAGDNAVAEGANASVKFDRSRETSPAGGCPRER